MGLEPKRWGRCDISHAARVTGDDSRKMKTGELTWLVLKVEVGLSTSDRTAGTAELTLNCWGWS